MNPKPTRAQLEYLMRQPKHTVLVFGMCTYAGREALRKLYTRHGFEFHTDPTPGHPWPNPKDITITVIYTPEMATEQLRADHAKALDPYGEQSRVLTGVSFDSERVSFPLPPAPGLKLRQLPVLRGQVGLRCTADELEYLDGQALAGESRSATAHRLAFAGLRINSPASPETT